MTILNILQFPNPRLRTKAKRVDKVDAGVRRIVDDMFETMYAENGAGLAATQVDIHRQIIVMDLSKKQDAEPLCVINPEIIHSEGIQFESEGCLSFPDLFEKVERAAKISLRALDQDGKQYEIEAEGVFAVCIQHEMDHLAGILFIDHLSRLRQERARKKLNKLRHQTVS